MYEMKVGLHGSAEEYDEDEDPDFGVGFEARRVAANRQRLRDQATLVVTIVLAIMVGILSLKMFDMNAMIVELRAAQVEPVRPRPDYVGAADAFVGGYSRQGHTLDVDGELTSFHIGQECICECNGTSTGIFCRGANPMHSFLAVASTELDDDTWSMEHWSVDSAKSWRSTSRFGNTPGGHHSTKGLTDQGRVFRSWSSQTGCAANEHDENSDGARECLTICAAFDLPTEPIRRKCGF